MTLEQNLRLALRPGDAILYKSKGFYGWLIALKTWHHVSHVEIYMGFGLSAASRDKIGVGLYPLRTSELEYVWRPHGIFDAPKALTYVNKHKGEPYGWLDLLAFVGLKTDGKGIVCSPFATDVQRSGGIDPFNGEDSRNIAPFQWLTSPAGDIYDVSEDGALTPRKVGVREEEVL
jgi:hypothetical protein